MFISELCSVKWLHLRYQIGTSLIWYFIITLWLTKESFSTVFFMTVSHQSVNFIRALHFFFNSKNCFIIYFVISFILISTPECLNNDNNSNNLFKPFVVPTFYIFPCNLFIFTYFTRCTRPFYVRDCFIYCFLYCHNYILCSAYYF
uniref:Uncharacterized protein n=2 Tax=Cacopsylla melanoneura TaxID=428564 RepID=A0A8D8S9E2_9HEMI